MSGLIACHECDLMQRVGTLPEGSTATCVRCGAILHKRKPNSIERTLAFALSGLILFGVTNAFPFLSLKIGAQVQETKLITGILELHKSGMSEIAFLVFFTTILVPFLQLTGILYVVLSVRFGRLYPKFRRVFRYINLLQPWGMMEVFMLGILVSIVKLAKMAKIIPGNSIFAFFALIVVIAAAISSLDMHLVWEKCDQYRKKHR